jgi:hypothetical protein
LTEHDFYDFLLFLTLPLKSLAISRLGSLQAYLCGYRYVFTVLAVKALPRAPVVPFPTFFGPLLSQHNGTSQKE